MPASSRRLVASVPGLGREVRQTRDLVLRRPNVSGGIRDRAEGQQVSLLNCRLNLTEGIEAQE